MLKTMIRVGDKLPTHPASITIKFESKLISPLNSRRGGDQFPYDSSQTALEEWSIWKPENPIVSTRLGTGT